MIVPCKKTVVSEEQARLHLGAALETNGITNPRSVALLMGHWGLETARGNGMYNNNFGNIGASSSGDSFRFEDCGFATPPGNPVYFAAYPTLEAGALALVSLLKRRYTEAWAELTSDNPDAYSYVSKLRARGYFTAPLESYQAGVASLYREYSLEMGVPPDPKGGVSPGGGDLPLLPLPATIQFGSKGNWVRRWQAIIGVTIDGIFGPLTRQATTIYQVKHGLKVDGIVGPKTWTVALSPLRVSRGAS